jgi:hypothetical protein
MRHVYANVAANVPEADRRVVRKVIETGSKLHLDSITAAFQRPVHVILNYTVQNYRFITRIIVLNFYEILRTTYCIRDVALSPCLCRYSSFSLPPPFLPSIEALG